MAQARNPLAEAPLLGAALAFAGGLMLGRWWWLPPLWWLLATLAFMAASVPLLRRRLWLAHAVAHLALVAVAALLWQGHAASLHAPDLTQFDGKQVWVTAHVTRDSRERRGAVARQMLEVESEELQVEGEPPVRLNAGLRLSIFSRGPVEEEEAEAAETRGFHYGHRLRFLGRLRVPRNFGNPGSFDYRGYLAEQGIVATASARADRVEELPGFAGTRLGDWRSRIRRDFLARIERLWPVRQAALLDAMLVSEGSLLERETRADFQRSGVYHVLVVSGLNVSILFGFVFFLLRGVRAPVMTATAAALLAAALYAWLADNGTPVWRATLMLAVYVVARLLYRERVPLNAIGVAALALMAFDPRALFGASFQLSFLAVIAIAGIAMPVIERTSAPRRRALRALDSTDFDLALEPRLAQWRLDLRLVARRMGHLLGGAQRTHAAAQYGVRSGAAFCLRIYELVIVSVAMQLALSLPMAVYFHRATTLAVPANVAAVPIMGWTLPAAAMAVAASYLGDWLARPLAWTAGLGLDFLTSTTHQVGALHLSDIRLPAPSALTIALAATAVVAAIFALRRQRWIGAGGVMALAAASVWMLAAPVTPQLRPGVLEITALDVGQGDSLLVIAPNGDKLLVDGGGALGPSASNLDFGEDIVSPYLWQRGITRLDAVALTHAHADHLAGLRAVLRNLKPRELWLGAMPDVPAVRALLDEAAVEGTRIVRYCAGDTFEFGGMPVRVLAPPPDWRPSAEPRNNDSLVLRIGEGASSALLAGDIEKKIERLVVAEQPTAELLKVPHHGSNTSTTRELLAAVRPQAAVISAGFRNSFGHPRPEVLRRLAAARVRTYRTDTMGAVTFYLDGRGVTATLPNLR